MISNVVEKIVHSLNVVKKDKNYKSVLWTETLLMVWLKYTIYTQITSIQYVIKHLEPA